MGFFESVLGRTPDYIINKELFERAKSDAKKARETISNHLKDIQLRRGFLKAMESHNTGKQDSLQKEFQDLHETAADKKLKKEKRPEYKMSMAPDELQADINIFLEATLYEQANLLEALKNQRLAEDQSVSKEIGRLEATLSEALNKLEKRRLELGVDLSHNSRIYGSAAGEGSINSEKINDLTIRIDRIRNVLSMREPQIS